MMGKLRNMATIYLFRRDKVLLLFRQGGRVVNDVWTGSVGGHFEDFEINNASLLILLYLLYRVQPTSCLMKVQKNAHPLFAPTNGNMNRTIHESASCTAHYRFLYKKKVLCDFVSEIASFEFEYFNGNNNLKTDSN